jgi:glycosyltransferase involved in cell wall biosynthesis
MADGVPQLDQPAMERRSPKKLRVTMVLPPVSIAGGIRVLAIYADQLTRRGHDVLVVSVPPRLPPLRSRLKMLLTGQGWPNGRPQPSYFDHLKVNHKVLETYRPVDANDVPDADVVMATYWTTAPWVAALSAEKGAKAFLIQGYEVVPGEQNANLDAAWRLPLHKIVISRWLMELAKDHFGDPEVSHVPNSVDLEQFHAPPRGKQPRPTVGFLYSHSQFKGAHLVPEVVEKLRDSHPDLQVVSFGADAPDSDLPLPPGTDYTRLPAQEAIREIYAACDVWMCASRREGFHLPPLEAMACRCPVVSTRVGGPMDIIEDGLNGHLVEVGDVDALAERARRVLDLPEADWRRMSEAAYETARRYSWSDATERLESALRRAMERERPGFPELERRSAG